jgi:aspartate/methionine/tyrosine aminotransferase
VQEICDHLVMMVKKMHGLDVNPLSDIAICCGQTEAFAAAVFASKLYVCFSCYFMLLFELDFCVFEYICDTVYCYGRTVIDRGDEVVLFDPSYETYEGCITMAGGVPVSFLLLLRA